MKEIVIQRSRLRLTLLLLGSCAFVAVSLFFLFGPDASQVPADYRWVLWVGVIFFGVGVLGFARNLLHPRPAIIMNDRGINVFPFKLGFIPWNEVSGADEQRVSRQVFVCLRLGDPQRWIQKMSPLKRKVAAGYEKLGISPFAIDLADTSVRPDQLVETIRANCGGEKT